MYRWTRSKNRDNKQKHGLYLSEVTGVFDDPNLLELYDSGHSDLEEARYITIGHLEGVGVMFVVTTDNPDGTVQLITARKATPKETEAYHEHFRETIGGD